MKYTLPFLTLLLVSCGTNNSPKTLVRNYGYTQGTTYSISYMSEKGKDYQIEIDSVLLAVDNSLSTYNKESTISMINRNESVKTDSLFRRVFKASQEIAKATQGAFEPTLAPVVNYWGFGFEDIPNKDLNKLNNLMQSVGYSKIQLKNSLVYKDNHNTQLDFNAIAQGFTVDLVAEHLEKLGINNYMIEIGGELKCNGLNADDKLWRIGIDKPSEKILEDRFQAIIEVKNKSVASSGNYRKFTLDETTGAKYAHTINPHTGRPVQTNLLAVTIVSESCMEADAYATAFMVMGLEKSQVFLKTHPELDALLIYSDPKGEWLQYQTKGFEKMSIYSSKN